MNDGPFISFVVVVARNNIYGGDFLNRLQNFIDVLSSLWQKHNLSAELIIVEWNTPRNIPPLTDVIKLPEAARGKIRIITVLPEVHETIPNPEKIPYFEFIGKNVGIRRARGKFILATNPDLLYSEQLIKFLATANLSEDTFYRVDRYDFNGPLPENLSAAQKIKFARKNVFKIETLGGTIPIDPQSKRPVWLKYFLGYRKYKSAKKKAGSNEIVDWLHTNASGDFFLMSKENWLKIKGYPELQTNFHTDSYVCCIAIALGLKQKILTGSKIIFHQEHTRTTSHRTEDTYKTWLRESTLILNHKRTLPDNPDNWGLINYDFKERLL
jgi:hypothetical protein